VIDESSWHAATVPSLPEEDVPEEAEAPEGFARKPSASTNIADRTANIWSTLME
jgi:hypothetical protein